MVKIPNNIIEEIIRRNDIVNIISGYVNLEKKGKNYFGLCPFHHEKTPSFSVSSEKQIFHCFSCGEGGNVVHFLSKIENISYIDSIKKLANQINININEFYDDNDNEKTKYYNLNKFVSDYYQFTLMNTSEGKLAINYLTNRGLKKDTIKNFKIGLAPDSIDSLYQSLKSNSFSELSMIELGHVNKTNNRYYDKFKKRIMFPITDEFGNIVGFSGRVYLNENKNEPKYINTQETPIFKKSNIIYNLNNAKKFIKQNDKVFLFEGFMDVIASVNCGLKESVATMGTALTDSQVKKLKYFTNNFVLCYDGDEAGIKATSRAINTIIKHNVNIFIIQLPEGLDPDDFVKKYGENKYLEFITNNQKSYLEYMYNVYYKDINLNNITTIETFKQKVFQLISNSSSTVKELFLNKLSNDINVSINTLNFDFENSIQYKTSNKPSYVDVINQKHVFKSIEKNRPNSKKLIEAENLLTYMFFYNRKYIMLVNNDSSITIPDPMYRRLFYELSEFYSIYDKFSQEKFIEQYVIKDEKYHKFFLELYKGYLENDKSNYKEKYFKQCLAVIKAEIIAKFVETLKSQLHNTEDDIEKLEITQKIINQYKYIKTSKK